MSSAKVSEGVGRGDAATDGALADGAGRGWDARRVLYAVLGLQLVMAVLLAGGDVLGALPRLLAPSSAPGFDAPVAPGDQTRRYAPRDTPLPDQAPGDPAPSERPYRNTGDMPGRLEFTRQGDALHVAGTIVPGDDDRLLERLEDAGLARVILSSPGGSVGDALAIGRGIRAAGLSTEIEAGDVCFSACPYMLAGGVERRVGAGAQVGVHQHYFGKNTVLPAFLAVEDIQRGQGDVMEFLHDMGIDIRLMRPALATGPDEIYLLLREELEDYRLVTDAADG